MPAEVSVYNADIELYQDLGAFTLMVTTGKVVGGHAMMAFEWLDKNSVHRHDIYHLHTGNTSSSLSNLICANAVVNKVVRGSKQDVDPKTNAEVLRYINMQIGLQKQEADEVFKMIYHDYIGEKGNVQEQKFFRKGENFEITGDRTATLNVPKKDLKFGVMAGRLIILGQEVDHVKTKTISVLFGQMGGKSTNCVNFSREISALMGVRWDTVMDAKAKTSTYKAINLGTMLHMDVTDEDLLKRRERIAGHWKVLKSDLKRKANGNIDKLFTAADLTTEMKIIDMAKAQDKDAGHGKQSKVRLQIGDDVLPAHFRQKPCTGVEAYAYARLTESKLSEFMPKLGAVIMDGKTYSFYHQNKKNSRHFVVSYGWDKKLALKECQIVIEDVAFAATMAWRCKPGDIDVIDIKIGSHIYLDDELKLNGHVKKDITKAGQNFTVLMSKLGGSEGIMVAKGGGLLRALNYIDSKAQVQKFFKALDKPSRLMILEQLNKLFTYMYDKPEAENNNSVSFVGASLLFLKQKQYTDRYMMTFIDLDHTIFKDKAEASQFPYLFWEATGNFLTGLGDLMMTIASVK